MSIEIGELKKLIIYYYEFHFENYKIFRVIPNPFSIISYNFGNYAIILHLGIACIRDLQNNQ